MLQISRGKGKLFTDPDPDKAREYFKNKNRQMRNKVTSVQAAVKKFVHNGDYLAIGGFGSVRIPTAVLHEIVRQRKRNLGFAGHTSTHDFQILAAGKCLKRIDAAYVVGLEARGLSKVARNIFESGEVEVTEWTNAALCWRLKAAAMGIPFVPARNMMGTDTFVYSGAIKVRCPFTKKEVVVYPALYPDVAVIHVHAADIYGNCRIKGITISDLDLAQAAKKVIITTEQLIPHEEIRSNPGSTSIAWYNVDAVIEVPYGSYPGNMPYEYFSDEEHLKEWLEAEKDLQTFKEFLDKYIYNCKDFNEYLELNGGIRKISKLRTEESLVSNKKR